MGGLLRSQVSHQRSLGDAVQHGIQSGPAPADTRDRGVWKGVAKTVNMA